MPDETKPFPVVKVGERYRWGSSDGGKATELIVLRVTKNTVHCEAYSDGYLVTFHNKQKAFSSPLMTRISP